MGVQGNLERESNYLSEVTWTFFPESTSSVYLCMNNIKVNKGNTVNNIKGVAKNFLRGEGGCHILFT